MASPIDQGTMVSSAYSSKDITILFEKIFIRIDNDFKTAKFIVEYTINSDITGTQIPLLFYAKDYKNNFSVWLDNQIVAVKPIPQKYRNFKNSPFAGFENSLEKYDNNSDHVSISWINGSWFLCEINELKYFETTINKGVHTVRIEYTAEAWTDVSDWIKKSSFRYSLSPAKYWKSFGTLNITVEQEGILKQLSTNIGQPIEKDFKEKNTWSFNKLPNEFLEISYIPTPNKIAAIFLSIEPSGIAIIVGIILFIVHLLFTKIYRKNNLTKKYSIVIILGSILVPFLTLLCFMLSFNFIDNLIGSDAGRHHGYYFLIIVFYPIILPIYWTIMWFIDKQIKRKLISQKSIV
jgi:hypothetical protein